MSAFTARSTAAPTSPATNVEKFLQLTFSIFRISWRRSPMLSPRVTSSYSTAILLDTKYWVNTSGDHAASIVTIDIIQ